VFNTFGCDASADIKEERQEGDRLLGYMEPNEIYQFIRSGPQGITLKLHRMEIPTIAMVNGLAIGDGFDFVLACDIRIGCERSRFMNAFLQMGLVSNTGATWLYPRAMGVNQALELLYTGDWLEAEDALRLGVPFTARSRRSWSRWHPRSRSPKASSEPFGSGPSFSAR